MRRLRRADCSAPGIRRLRRGRGFAYVEESTGERIDDPDTLERIRELVIPPAWTDVWVCPWSNGHLQAVGVDARGRKQYRYHDRWRLRRDQQKFDEMVDFARALPRLRGMAAEHLERDELTRERVLAGAVRLLDRGFFRIGGERYADENETYGLATMKRRHAHLVGNDVVRFDYVAKAGKERVQSVVDPRGYDVVAALKRRRGRGDELLAYRLGRAWVDVRSEDINAYIKAAAARISPPRISVHGTAPCSPPSGSPSRHMRRRGRRPASGRSTARSQRSRATSATRRRCAAPRTSTRACSTATTPASRSRRRSKLWGRRSRRACAPRPVEDAVLDLLEDERSPALERVRHRGPAA